ncbi:uncharacterized protein LOC129720434 [Wyeomyia smithii]|uniref:uncharacterized protein LOC129720434 n=1 Tax=Wyeomyia smithii TaxID=174621 RepID=UPI0024681896|nr:uncharacterized protein LOC129720434 [Wyeomyia smithii]
METEFQLEIKHQNLSKTNERQQKMRTTISTIENYNESTEATMADAIDNITPNVQISRIRDGSLLLKTTDQNQAVKLMKQSTLAGEIGIKICEHPTLNHSRGTIYCLDLISLKDEEILEGLKESQVVAVRRMTRITKEKKSEDTGTFILTFNLSQIPPTMDVGFYNCRVRQYVAAPLRCTNCLKFGNKADQCRGNKVCADCAQLYHDNVPCSSKQVCANCRNEHNLWSKKCSFYEDEFEIQRIRVTEKLPMREARKKRRSQVPAPIFATTTPNRSFAGVLRESLPTHNEQRREHQDRHPAQPTDKQLNEKHEVGRQLPHKTHRESPNQQSQSCQFPHFPPGNNITKRNPDQQILEAPPKRYDFSANVVIIIVVVPSKQQQQQHQ